MPIWTPMKSRNSCLRTKGMKASDPTTAELQDWQEEEANLELNEIGEVMRQCSDREWERTARKFQHYVRPNHDQRNRLA